MTDEAQSETGETAVYHVRFAQSETVYRLHWPPRKGDFYGRKYYTGKRWVRRNRKHMRRLRPV